MAFEEEWETTSGLALDGATATVTNVEFGFNANMGAGITCANFTMTSDDGDEMEQSFSVGGKFEANRDGSEVTGSGGFSKNSNFGLLIESVKEVLADAGESPGDVIGSPRVAANWIGTKWTWGTITRDVKNPSTGEMKTGATKFVVTAYHGKDEDADTGSGSDSGSGAKKTAGAKKAAPKKAAAKKGGPPEGIPEDHWTYYVDTAKAWEGDHSEFVAAMMEDEDVQNNEAAQKAVMGTKAGSVWAAAGRD